MSPFDILRAAVLVGFLLMVGGVIGWVWENADSAPGAVVLTGFVVIVAAVMVGLALWGGQ